MKVHIHGLKQIQDDLLIACDNLLAADTNRALTNLNKAINDLKQLRKFLEGEGEDVS